ncbi:hypothetical protein DOM21_08885 [Bacteriovorax stolpii]|uniref:Ig-like domain-containing protein n=1 Tax=Bacteriovorax stolpii TaxID=960 RepID=UPI00115BAB9E|nr:Ig-like domain-containing protein [Bacteriovorax stolpii]QDK41565.1 hypothetical protein DOM21_08885 [Bacteriovorax stolpii]
MEFSSGKRIFLFIYLFVLFLSFNSNNSNALENILGQDAILVGGQVDLSVNNHKGIYERFKWIVQKNDSKSIPKVFISSNKFNTFLNKTGEYQIYVQGFKDGEWIELASKSVIAVPSVSSEILSFENVKPSTTCRLTLGLFDCFEFQRSFDIQNPSGTYSIVLINDQLKNVSVTVNGESLTKRLSLNDHNETVVERVILKKKNTISIKVGAQGIFDDLNHNLNLKIVKDIDSDDLRSGQRMAQNQYVKAINQNKSGKYFETNQPPVPTAQNIKILQNFQGVTRISPNDPDINQIHSYAITTGPENGVAYVTAQGFLYYLPLNNYFGADQVVVEVKDNGSPSLSASITVDVQVEQNIAPNPIAADINVYQNSIEQTFVNPNDPNTVSQSFTYEIYQNAAHGILTPYGSRFTYRPASNYVGTDSFIIKVSDSGLPALSALKTVNVTVSPNTIPVISVADQTIFQAQKISLPVTFNDPDVGQSHYFSIEGRPTKGTAVINQQGVLYYSAKPGEVGQDSIVVAVKDSAGGVGTKNILITIVGNSLPILGEINDFFIFPGGVVNATITYTDADLNQKHTFLVLSKGKHGKVLLTQQGILTYIPDDGFIGTDSITIAVSDNANPVGIASKAINITVRPNSKPVVIANDLISIQGEEVATQVSFTDADIGQQHTFSIVTMPAHGTASLNQSGLLTYSANSGYRGSDSIVVAVSDNVNPPGIGTKTINISVIDNTIPVVAGNNIVLPQGGVGSTLITFTDPDVGQTHTFQVSISPSHGTATFDQNHNVNYTHTDKCSIAPDTFSVSVADSANPPGIGTKTINVSFTPNTKPTAIIADFSIQQNESSSKQLTVSDPDAGETFTYSIKTGAQHGNATVSSTGLVTYTHLGIVPSATDTFEVSIKDRMGDCSGGEVVKIVNVNILPNRVPTLNIADLIVEEDSSTQTIMNANDPDQYQVLDYIVSIPPVNGTVVVNQFGNLTYTPNAGYSGHDEFKITVKDNGQPILSAEKIVNVTVVPKNSPPNPTSSSIAVLSGLSGSTTISPGDPDVSQIHTFEIISSPTLGTATVNNFGVLTFIANPGAVGLEEIQVRVTDNGTFPQSAIVYVPVQVIQNLPPNPTAISEQVISGMTRLFAISPNDPNEAQFPQAYSFIIETQPAQGTAVVDEEGNLSYTAAVGFVGTITFDVKVLDEGNPQLSGLAHVTLDVLANSAPVVASASLTTDLNVSLNHQIQFSDANSEYQTFTYSISEQGSHGVASVDALGMVTYEPEEDYLGEDSIVVTVTDNGNPALSGNATYSINVQDSNNIPPVMSGVSHVFESTSEPAFVRFNLLDLMDTDGEIVETKVDFGDGSPILVIKKNDLGPNNGRAFLDRFNHFYRQYGTYLLTVKVKDNSNAVTTETRSIVYGPNTPPVPRMNYDVLVGQVPLTINLNGSPSTDADGTIQRYTFNVLRADNRQNVYSSSGTGIPAFAHTLNAQGKYILRVCLVDDKQAIRCNEQFAYAGTSRPDYGGRISYASFSATPRQGSAGYSISLNGSASTGAQSAPIVAYQWKVTSLLSEQNGRIYSDFATGVNASMTLPYSGLYYIQLTVTDQNGNQSTAQTSVIVDGPSSQPELIAVNYGNGTFGYRLETNGKPIDSSTIYWDLGNGTFATGNQVFTTYGIVDTYAVKAQVIDANGVKYELTKTINLNDDPTFPSIVIGQVPNGTYNPNQSFNIDVSGTTDSHGPLTFTWTFGEGIPSITGVGNDYAVISGTYPTPGDKKVELRVTNTQGFSSLYTFPITFRAAGAGSQNGSYYPGSVYPGRGSAPLTVNTAYNTLNDNSALYYIWNFGRYDGDIVVTSAPNAQNTYYHPGSFAVNVTSVYANGNRKSSYIGNVNVNSYNQKPVVVGQNLTLHKNTSVTTYVSYSDPDLNIQLHNFSISQQPVNGVASISASGKLVYIPNSNYLGNDTLKVRVTDNATIPASGEANINFSVVEPNAGNANMPPEADDLYYGFENSSYPRQVYFTLAGLHDPDGFISKVVWDFGDGSAPVEITKEMLEDGVGFEESYHLYTQNGTYPVIVKAYDNKGAILTVNSSVVMAANSLPVPRFTTNVTGTGPYTITLNASASTDADGTIEEYCWYVTKDGDEYHDECDNSPIHTVVVDDQGTYNFEFGVSDNAHGSRFTNFSMMVDGSDHNQDVPPSAKINTAQSRIGSAPYSITWSSADSVAQNGKTIAKTLWKFSSKKVVNYGNAASPNYNYTIPCTDFITLRVFDSAGKSSKHTLPIYIGSAPTLQADFSIKGDGLNFAFDGSSWSQGHIADFFLWDFGDGHYGLGSNVLHQYEKEGEYRVVLTIMDLAGNVTSKSDTLIVGSGVRPPDDNISFPSPRRVVRVNQSTSFNVVAGGTGNFSTKVDYGDGTFSNNIFATHSYSATGVYRVRILTTDNDTGRSKEYFVFVSVVTALQEDPNFWVTPEALETPNTFKITVSYNSAEFSPTTFRWGIHDGQGLIAVMQTSSPQTTYTLPGPGNYSVEVYGTDAAGRVDYGANSFVVGAKMKNTSMIKELPMSYVNKKKMNYLRVLKNRVAH